MIPVSSCQSVSRLGPLPVVLVLGAQRSASRRALGVERVVGGGDRI